MKPDTSRDQYFLNEKYLRIEAGLACLNKNDVILEIGAGPGNLTRILAKKSRVIAIEKDMRFREILQNIKNTEIIIGDALKEMKNLQGYNKIVSNIPYSKSQEILIEMLQHGWDMAILIVQKEFAKKLMEKSKLGMIVNDCCDAKIEMTVPADAFTPNAVDSSIVILKQKKRLDMELWNFLDKIYKNKNRNAEKIFRNCGIKKKLHELTIDEIRRLKAAQKGI